MKSCIDELTKQLPPPNSPRNNSGEWPDVEQLIGTSLPQDFKDFTARYGTVKICNYLNIHTPFPLSATYALFLHSLSDEYDAVVGGREHIPYPAFPAPGGLLAIGTTDSADVISWITDGNPDEWGVFFWKWPGLETVAYRQLNLTAFLLELVTLKSSLFPAQMPVTFFSQEQRSIVQTG